MRPMASSAAARASGGSRFTTSPDFAAIAASSRAAALSVSRAEDLPGVLEEAVTLIRTRRQSVLVDVQLAR